MKWYREVFRESLSTPPSQEVPPFRAHEVISLCVQYLVSFWGLLELFLGIEHSFMKLTFESRQCCVRLNCCNTINTFWGYFGDQILGLTWVLMYWPCETVWSCCNSGMLSLTLLLMNFFLKSLLNVLQYCFCFMFWYFGHKTCWILALPLRFKPTPSPLQGKVLTTGPPGKSLLILLK